MVQWDGVGERQRLDEKEATLPTKENLLSQNDQENKSPHNFGNLPFIEILIWAIF